MDSKNSEREEKSSILSWITTIVGAVILYFIITGFILNTTVVIGESMQPTLQQNNRLISLKFPLYYSNPEQGDIIILDSPEEENKEYIKRVVGVPGDTIEIKDGSVYVNGQIYSEDYIEENTPTLIYNENSWTLGADEYFVMGDNRLPGKSLDSRYFGPINKDTIRGIANFRYWPISEFGSIGGLND
ncbi:signal peptidase I [Anaerosphaera aminiphila DSM 21120]|uniref:Signal peptidase I n=1 Tax=Anaerosphaera aminiphila DSM 21120 TaxID=1120995 RepID=A0A1M5RLA6_9FIRM|nr:signal peptidase I [Anaerosphaera aminiphila]SHH26916.1 signal peptidase I [Anaerosphaera aminiphila DSM 21120]